ncbi:DUF4360 domain-containing protein [Catenuloplanes indicus]|uniref:DUF4360 domain-containing protein n=1 Tax=Catenuloplanes indicus TaxID=137267 RepID=UPI0027D86778|nr:DUF4360 domain-containing protein [Catenuloplanes indicus]
MISTIAAVGAASALLLGGPEAGLATERAASRPPGAVSAKVVSVAGSGCPGRPMATAQGTADPTVFTIRHPGITARAGGPAQIFDRTKFCQVTVAVRAARGWTWTLSRVEQSGRAQLAGGAVGTARFSYYWTGEPKTGMHSKTLTGPRNTAWTTADTIGLKPLGWAPCGLSAHLNIKAEVSARPGADRRRTSTMTAGGAGNAPSTYRVSWKPC